MINVRLWSPSSEAYHGNRATFFNIARTSSKRQLRALNLYIHHLRSSAQLRALPLPESLLLFLENKAAAARHRWQPSTHLREAANLHGALKYLPKYSPSTRCSIDLGLSVAWKAALAAWSKQAIQHAPVSQAAASAANIAAAMSRTQDLQLRMFLLLLWLSCARKGDIANLRTSAVSFKSGPGSEHGHLEVFIERGKGVEANRAKYRIQTFVEEPFRSELRRFLTLPRPADSLLFRPSLGTSNEVTALLKTVHPKLNCRALRRGSLQTIAADPEVSEETLMRLSGHRNVKTLHRYLGWNEINAKAHRETVKAAKNLSRGLQL